MKSTIISLLFFVSFACAAELKPIVLDPAFEHNKWGTSPSDHLFNFAAYTTSFDGKDDNNGDGDNDVWGIPEWVAFEIKKNTEKHSGSRPKWMTDKTLHEAGIAPSDKTYAVSGTRQLKIVSGDYRFVRGHMCPKDTADRISGDAGYNTHVMMNAVPQLQWQNNGVWKKIEQSCNAWANKYERVWVVCGPVFFGKEPAMWLGQDGEQKIAIPDALFKIVIRKDGDTLKTLAFIIPNIVPKAKKDPKLFLTSIDDVEKKTGLDFLTKHQGISAEAIEEIEKMKAEEVDW